MISVPCYFTQAQRRAYLDAAAIVGLRPATWLLLHALFYATSMAVGFRFSRLIVFLLFLPTPPINPAAHLVSLVSSPAVALAGANATATITTTTTTTTTVTTTTTTVAADIGGAHPHHHHHRHGPVFVGRHPIRVRAWPHPDPSELLKAHRILAAVQNAQRSTKRRGAGPARPVIAVTPTTTSALQVPSLTSLAHTLRLIDARLVWIVVEPSHRTNVVAAVLSRSNLDFLHITGPGDSIAPVNPCPQVCTQAPTARWEGSHLTHTSLSTGPSSLAH